MTPGGDVKNVFYDFVERVVREKTGHFINWPLAGVLARKKLWRKLFNYLIVQAQFHFQTSWVFGRPYYLCFDPVTACNLKCPLCKIGTMEFPKPRERMDMAVFRKILDTLGPELLQVDIYVHGEPLLNPDVYEMISYCKKYKTTVKMSSNLQEVDADRLVGSGLDQLFVAIDGATQETYEKYRMGGSLEKAFTNARNILAARRRAGKKTPLVTWKYIVFRHNEAEIDLAKKAAAEMGFDEIDFNGAIVKDAADPTQMHTWVPQNPEHSLYAPPATAPSPAAPALQKSVDLSVRKPQCNWPWISATLDPRGNVQTCCVSVRPEEDMGNIMESRWGAIWNNARYRRARRFLARHRPSAAGWNIPCERCRAAGNINLSLTEHLLRRGL